MPVDLTRVDDIAAMVAAIYREAETALLHDVTRRLDTGLDRTDWQTTRYAAVAALRRQAGAVVTALAWSSDREVHAAVAAGYRAGNHDAVRELAGRVAPHLAGAPQPVGAAARQSMLAVQALADATVRETRPLYAAVLPQVEGAYRQAITGAVARKLGGAATMREAAQAAYAALVERGITSMTDTRGRQWRLHTYAEMAVRTAVARAATVGLVDQFTAAGVRLVSVDDQPGECPRCRPYEHQVLALWGPVGVVDEPDARGRGTVRVHVVATLDQAQAAGLMHPHCRHTIRAYLPGVSMLIKQGRTADPAGAAARERQREIERALRGWREREAAALTTQARTVAAGKIRQWDAAMGAHIAASGLTRQRYRETIGAGVIPPPGRVDARAARLGVPQQPTLWEGVTDG